MSRASIARALSTIVGLDIGEPQREIYIAPRVLPLPLEPHVDPEPVEAPVEAPAHEVPA